MSAGVKRNFEGTNEPNSFVEQRLRGGIEDFCFLLGGGAAIVEALVRPLFQIRREDKRIATSLQISDSRFQGSPQSCIRSVRFASFLQSLLQYSSSTRSLHPLVADGFH